MKKTALLSTLLFLVSGLFAGGSAWLYGKDYLDIIRLVIIAFLGSGMIIFLYAEGRERGNLLQDNSEHFGRFFLLYCLALLAALAFPLLPEAGWSYLVIFVVLGLVSNQTVGICSGSMLLMISVFLHSAPSTSSLNIFFTYFLGGAAAIFLFASIDEAYRVGLPLLLSLLLNIVSIAANMALTGQSEIDFETVFAVSANTLVCLLLLLVFLRYYSTNVVHLARNTYMIINDPECPVLVELKNKSKSEYYQAVHTAYLSDKIAKRLGLDNMAAKTCGYYHKIGTLRGENSWEAIHKICQEYRFPAAAVALLKEYTDRESSLTSKEAIVVLFADTLVASLLYIFSKDPTAKPDYDQIVDAVYEKKLESGIIDKSMVTVGEMKVIRQMLKEEHLYYDFLR